TIDTSGAGPRRAKLASWHLPTRPHRTANIRLGPTRDESHGVVGRPARLLARRTRHNGDESPPKNTARFATPPSAAGPPPVRWNSAEPQGSAGNDSRAVVSAAVF